MFECLIMLKHSMTRSFYCRITYSLNFGRSLMSYFLTTQSYREEFPDVFATVSCDGNMTGTDVLSTLSAPDADLLNLPASVSWRESFPPGSPPSGLCRHQVHRVCWRWSLVTPLSLFCYSNLLNRWFLLREIQNLMVCTSHLWFQNLHMLALSLWKSLKDGYLVSKH